MSGFKEYFTAPLKQTRDPDFTGVFVRMWIAGLLNGTFAGLVFVGLQRLWNPSDGRVVRLRNYFAAVMIVGLAACR
jgi:hypothetical protein